MELTPDQALKKGIEAHRAGQFQEADQFYTAILKVQPKHADANHNMGVLAVSIGAVTKALPFFKTALEANPKMAQYWLSYIDALIKMDRIQDAKAVLDQAKSKGAMGSGFDRIELQLKTSSIEVKKNETQEDAPNKSNILYELKLDKAIKLAKKKVKDDLSEEAKRIYKDILKKFPKNKKALDGIKTLSSKTLANTSDMQEPPNDQLQSLVNLYSKSQYQQALTHASQLLKHFSGSATLYNIIGVANQNLGKLKEALEAYKKALSIKPDYMDTYNNMGTALKEQGKLDEAIEAFNKALSIKPNYAEAYYNMGSALKEQGKLDEAIEAFNKALSIKPNYAEAHNSTGNVLKQQGKLDEAIEAFNKALSIKPDHGRAKHMLSALTGNTNETAPREYVEGLFDGYAKKFEASLVVKLEYKIPKLIKDILSKSNHNEALGSILDLGCGTGLFGSEIKNYCSNLEGIDLSQRMLAIAAEKNIYDKLTQGDILEYLSSNNMSFDYLVAADVFVYIGDLSKIFRLIKSKNKKPGKLVFSTEHSEQDGYHILKTGRYSHSKSYVESLCKKFDYTISHFSTSDLRKEEGHFLTGAIYVLSF